MSIVRYITASWDASYVTVRILPVSVFIEPIMSNSQESQFYSNIRPTELT